MKCRYIGCEEGARRGPYCDRHMAVEAHNLGADSMDHIDERQRAKFEKFLRDSEGCGDAILTEAMIPYRNRNPIPARRFR